MPGAVGLQARRCRYRLKSYHSPGICCKDRQLRGVMGHFFMYLSTGDTRVQVSSGTQVVSDSGITYYVVGKVVLARVVVVITRAARNY